jgi:hypothetical protein
MVRIYVGRTHNAERRLVPKENEGASDEDKRAGDTAGPFNFFVKF